MIIRTLATGVALAVLVSSAASAAPQTKALPGSPKQPIPYSQLDSYLKASPKTRASKDWWSGSASTGMSADTSATMPAADPATTTSTTTTTDTSVNPPASTMPSDSSTSMPSTPPTMPDATMPAPGSNLPTTPAEPK